MTTNGEQSRNESYQADQPTTGKRAVVLEWVRARGKFGCTREEIAEGTGFRLSSVCGRVNELEESELLVTTTERRRGVSGKALSVVVAKEFASGVAESQGGGTPVCQVVRSDSPSGAGRAQGVDEPRSGGDVRAEQVDSRGHPLTTQLAAFAEKRAAAVQQLNLF